VAEVVAEGTGAEVAQTLEVVVVVAVVVEGQCSVDEA
jgi:hypothetical protein